MGSTRPYLQTAGQTQEGIHAELQVQEVQGQQAEQVHLKPPRDPIVCKLRNPRAEGGVSGDLHLRWTDAPGWPNVEQETPPTGLGLAARPVPIQGQPRHAGPKAPGVPAFLEPTDTRVAGTHLEAGRLQVVIPHLLLVCLEEKGTVTVKWPESLIIPDRAEPRWKSIKTLYLPIRAAAP